MATFFSDSRDDYDRERETFYTDSRDDFDAMANKRELEQIRKEMIEATEKARTKAHSNTWRDVAADMIRTGHIDDAVKLLCEETDYEIQKGSTPTAIYVVLQFANQATVPICWKKSQVEADEVVKAMTKADEDANDPAVAMYRYYFVIQVFSAVPKEYLRENP